ncbi:MAG: acyl-CoA desaturase [Cyclobacteriaceae bacterium]
MHPVFILLIAHWYLSLFCQTFFLHRYAAHKMFTMNKFWEKVFYIFTFICQGSSFLSPYAYGLLHRMHHAYTDTEKDPHSPSYDKNLFAMMLRTKNVYNDILNHRVEIDERFKGDVPYWKSLENIGDNWMVRLMWVAVYVGFYFYFIDLSTEWWMLIFLPANFLMGPLHGAVINWFAHKYGYTNFKVKDTSKNLMPLDVFMFGEGYHNNHHKNGQSPNFGFKWYEIDPAWLIIWTLNKLSIIKITKQEVAA